MQKFLQAIKHLYLADGFCAERELLNDSPKYMFQPKWLRITTQTRIGIAKRYNVDNDDDDDDYDNEVDDDDNADDYDDNDDDDLTSLSSEDSAKTTRGLEDCATVGESLASQTHTYFFESNHTNGNSEYVCISCAKRENISIVSLLLLR